MGIVPWSIVRLVGAVLIVAAIVAQLSVTLGIALASSTPYGSHVPTVLANFFSFFTIESNVLAVIALILGGVWGLRIARAAADPGRATDAREPRGLAVLFACTATYMIVTGVVYNLLLRGIPLPQGSTVPWSNEVLHVVGPLLLVADVLLAPRRRRLGWGVLGIIAAFPVVWAVYTLLRAPLVISPATGERGWYPYPFLNPANFDHALLGGYAGVAGYILGIAVAILAIGAGVLAVSRARGR